jgi:hypothetical protein
MRQYVQHRDSNTVHIVRNQWENGTYDTQCGKWYVASMAYTPGLRGEREEDVVCYECRRKAAAAAGKRVYSKPTLRRGLSEAKRAKLRKAQQAHTDRQRLAAWNAAAQERTP